MISIAVKLTSSQRSHPHHFAANSAVAQENHITDQTEHTAAAVLNKRVICVPLDLHTRGWR